MGFDNLNSTMNATEDYKGKKLMGVVVSIDDPLNLSRVKANVPGLYDVNTDTLEGMPWIGPEKQSLFGIGLGFGMYGVPQVGSVITVILQDEDEHHPMYTGSILTAPNVDPEFQSPRVWGFKDPAGNKLRVDLQGNTWHFNTGTGWSFDVDSSGKATVVMPAGVDVNVTGNASLAVSGTLAATCQSFNLTASGQASYSASMHLFNGPVQMSSTLATAGSITDETALGNTRTIGNLRQIYNIHTHHANGENQDTNQPNQQI